MRSDRLHGCAGMTGPVLSLRIVSAASSSSGEELGEGRDEEEREGSEEGTVTIGGEGLREDEGMGDTELGGAEEV